MAYIIVEMNIDTLIIYMAVHVLLYKAFHYMLLFENFSLARRRILCPSFSDRCRISV